MSNNIPKIENITDYLAKEYKKGNKPIYTPIAPQDYEGKQVILNADRLIFNARLAVDQGEAARYALGGDIHMFSHNFITLSTRGSIHLNTEHPEEIDAKENNKQYIMINAPNIFLGMDEVPEIGENKPIGYPTEPAVLGLKNEEFMETLILFIKTILERLATTNLYDTGPVNGVSVPRKETWEDLSKDVRDGAKASDEDPSIGKLREMLRNIKSNHVFIKK